MKVEPIGFIETPFAEKFGVPRQSLMVKQARGIVRLEGAFSNPDLVLHLNEFSHVWLIYVFHKAQNENHPESWSPTIIPPRIEAPKKVGVFASRSPHRPNPIGMSVVKLEEVRILSGRIEIEVSGVDLLDQTPILDIKPYVSYADSVNEASSGWIRNEITRYEVRFSDQAMARIPDAQTLELIREILEWDPRPRSQREQCPIERKESDGRKFAFRLKELDIHWSIVFPGSIRVDDIIKLKEPVDESTGSLKID